ncbi:hypothetical protein C7E12_23640, partial [Stenotrophomonas maltophilia]
KAFTAGLDLSMQSGFYAEHLPGLVESGEVPMAAAKAFTAGLDLSMQSGFYAEHLPGLVESGEVPMA